MNGSEAVNAFRRLRPEVVIMDCQMPMMDGYEAARQIRAIEKADGSGQRCRIIAMTANALPGERIRSIDAGMDEHLSKPFDAEVFASMLESAATDSAGRPDMAAADKINLQQLADQIGHAAASELADMWQKETPKRLQRIDREFHRGNFDKVRKEAHALRGACSVFGLSEVMTACSEIEDGVLHGRADMPALLSRLIDAVKNASQNLSVSTGV
jgi:CheY-like chemotaxis protein/HPt (histidine-containing phosphotransfer) domain-containing protein